MGLPIVLCILAVPLILVGTITRFRGRPPSYVSREDLRPQVDATPGHMQSDLGHLLDEGRP